MKPSRLQKTLENTKRRRSTGVSTEENDVITENTKMAVMKENREPKFTAPPLFTEIRKTHYVCIYIYIYDIIHKYEILNVNKVNSKENTGSFKALRAKQT